MSCSWPTALRLQGVVCVLEPAHQAVARLLRLRGHRPAVGRGRWPGQSQLHRARASLLERSGFFSIILQKK
jgi:hypothetical protein